MSKFAELLKREGPLWMGIINVTPDSFSDGGKYSDVDAAVAHAVTLANGGAALVDVGGVSTRPGSLGVSVEEEFARVRPLLVRLRATLSAEIVVSLDSHSPAVARRCAQEGLIDVVNDVCAGLRAEEGFSTADVAAQFHLGFVAMHMQGDPQSMQKNPIYDDVVEEVSTFLQERCRALHAKKIEGIALDPGIGFGKTFEHNVQLLDAIPQLAQLGAPILIGLSRKKFLSEFSRRRGQGEIEIASGRDEITKEFEYAALAKGAKIIRTHRMP